MDNYEFEEYDYEEEDERICLACSVAGCDCDSIPLGEIE